MSNLSIFNFESHEIRSLGTALEPWFVGVDICKVLEISNSRDAISRLDQDEKDVATTNTLGGKQELVIINEPGLWSLVLTSRKPQAKRFKKWLTSEVIPAIRKTGTYSTQPVNSLTLIDTSKLDALVDREDRLNEDLRALEIRIAATKQLLQDIKRDKAAEAKAFAEKYPDVVRYSIKCSEILEAYGGCNKYFSNPLNR
ncbi:MAG: BRO family protein [Nostoc sp.]|uniref:BRO-N domain-containing protein n=1 Tax=Nostoc sp. TaxID=1180 RepID=UPI002FFBF4CD